MHLWLLLVLVASPAAKIQKHQITFAGKERSYYLFEPDNQSGPLPLLITLHGSGRDGKSLVSKWKKTAQQHGFLVLGPDALKSEAWDFYRDPAAFLDALVATLGDRVDRRRIYVFGHSAGGLYATDLAMVQSNYFAAVAVHAGMPRSASEREMIRFADRKMPMAFFVGDQDRFFPLDLVREFHEELKQRGFPIQWTEIPGHDHNYYGKAAKINKEAWAFLAAQRLDSDPVLKKYGR